MERRRLSLSKAREVANEGSKLSTEAVEALEKHLIVAAPDDLEARIKLLGYYVIRQFQSKRYRDRRSAHILWVIRASLAGKARRHGLRP